MRVRGHPRITREDRPVDRRYQLGGRQVGDFRTDRVETESLGAMGAADNEMRRACEDDAEDVVDEQPPRKRKQVAACGEADARPERLHAIAQDDASEAPDDGTGHQRPIAVQEQREGHGDDEGYELFAVRNRNSRAKSMLRRKLTTPMFSKLKTSQLPARTNMIGANRGSSYSSRGGVRETGRHQSTAGP